MNFDNFDKGRLEEARKLLWKVYEYNYGDPSCRREVNRLATIIGKLDELMNLKGEPHVRQKSGSPCR